MAELLGGMTQADFNQQMSTTTEEAMHARKARSAREASAGVATPVCTSARNNGGNEATPSTFPTPKTAQDNGKAAPATPGTRGRASNPTPKALFTTAPKRNKPRAKRSSWDTGPPPAATDAQGKSGPIRQPPAVGERVVAVDATAMARPQVEKVTAPCADLQIRQRR